MLRIDSVHTRRPVSDAARSVAPFTFARITAALLACALVPAATADNHTPEVLPDPTPDPIGSLGTAVALTPHWVVVGAEAKRFVNPQRVRLSQGAVLLWPRAADGSTGYGSVPPFVLWSTSPQRGGRFGAALAVEADRVLVGEPGFKTSTLTSSDGRVSLFDLSLAPPVEVAAIVAPLTESGREFGAAVGLLGERIVVGAPGHTPAGSTKELGAAFVYETSRAGLVLRFTLLAPATPDGQPGGAYERFATAVALHASDVLVGAPAGVDLPGLDHGRVYVYDAASGSLMAQLTAPTPTLGDRFGASIAVSGDLAAIAAPGDECGIGEVHLFRRGEGGWQWEATLSAPGDASEGWLGFGNAIAIERERVVVGTGGVGNDQTYGHRAAILRRSSPLHGGRAVTWSLEAIIDGDDGGAAAAPVALDPFGTVLCEPGIDLGQVRYQSSELSGELAADLDFDGLVGPADLAALLGAWGSTVPASPADLTRDGTVDQADLALLLGAWS